jgi:transcriptional regulator with XRE-family HTH domain
VTQISTVESNILDYRQIRTWRESAGLSQTELARQAGIGRSTLYLIEDGLLDTRVSTLLKIADALKISPARLLRLRRVVV